MATEMLQGVVDDVRAESPTAKKECIPAEKAEIDCKAEYASVAPRLDKMMKDSRVLILGWNG